MTNMWDIVGNISSICSIVGLPIALVQIFQIKSRAKSTEEGLNKLLEIKNNETIETILSSICNQQKELSNLQMLDNKEGTTPKAISEMCQNIISELNICIFNMPVGCENIAKNIENSIKYLREYLKFNDTNKINEATGYLYTTIRNLKKEKDKYSKSQLKNIAKN